MQRGVSLHYLVRMVLLVGDAPWSTAVAERLHSAVSLLSRHHPDYSLGSLLARSTVLTARKLLPAPTVTKKRVLKIRAKLNKSEKRNPNCITGRQAFFKELSLAAATRRLTMTKTKRKLLQQRIMNCHVTLQKVAGQQIRKECARRARVLTSVRRHEIQGEHGKLASELHVALQELAAENARREPLTLSAAQWAAPDLERFALELGREEMTPGRAEPPQGCSLHSAARHVREVVAGSGG